MFKVILLNEKTVLSGDRDYSNKKEEQLRADEKDLKFDEVYRLYGKRVLNLAFRMTSKEDTARDLTQDIFIKVYQNLGSFKEESQIYTWIYRIAVNHILNFLKKEKRFKWFSLMDKNVVDILHEDKIDASYWKNAAPISPLKNLEDFEREKLVRSIIDSLDVKYRVPFLLFRYEGLSYREIADSMKLSLSAVEARIHRAKKKIAEKIKPWLKEL